MNDPIYVITTVRYSIHQDHRPVGFYYDFDVADEAVRENSLDINEAGHYPYVVIEEIYQGMYYYPRKEYWYEWDRKTEKYNHCEKPQRYGKIQGWSIG